jgi:Domain of unknown function (DUF1902)
MAFSPVKGNAARVGGLREWGRRGKVESGRVWLSFANSALKCYRGSMNQKFKVTAIWDPEVKVFISDSNIPGLVVEADTFEEFVSLVEALAPEMLEANLPRLNHP